MVSSGKNNDANQVADEKSGTVWKQKPATPASDLAARVKAMAEGQIKMWQALLKELD